MDDHTEINIFGAVVLKSVGVGFSETNAGMT
jgi:hypothetical protein